MAAERLAEPALIELAYARGIALVAANEPFFAAREDYEAHDALICIAEGRLIADGERRQLTAEHRFKTPRRNGRIVRRPAGGARGDRGDRRALRLSAANAGADPAAFLRRPQRERSRRDEAARAARAGRGGQELRRAAHRLETVWPGSARAGHASRTIASGSPSSSA